MAFNPRLELLVLLAVLSHAGSFPFFQRILTPIRGWTRSCSEVCAGTPGCAAFTERRGTKSEIDAMECFVYDKLVQAVLEGVPSEAWRRSGDLNGTLEDLDIRRWFSQQPFVTDSNVFSNTEQHFVRGCSYTISLWVWLYKPRLAILGLLTNSMFTRPSLYCLRSFSTSAGFLRD